MKLVHTSAFTRSACTARSSRFDSSSFANARVLRSRACLRAFSNRAEQWERRNVAVCVQVPKECPPFVLDVGWDSRSELLFFFLTCLPRLRQHGGGYVAHIPLERKLQLHHKQTPSPPPHLVTSYQTFGLDSLLDQHGLQWVRTL